MFLCDRLPASYLFIQEHVFDLPDSPEVCLMKLRMCFINCTFESAKEFKHMTEARTGSVMSQSKASGKRTFAWITSPRKEKRETKNCSIVCDAQEHFGCQGQKKEKKKEHLKMRAARAWFQALNFGFADAIDDC